MITNQNSKTNLIEKISALFLALSLTACSITSVSAPSPSAPPATEAIPTATEIAIEMEGEPFSTTENLPEEIIPSMELFTEMAQSDGLDINELHPILWIKAAQGELSVNYALLQVATISDLTDPDGEPGNPKPVYYIAYRDEEGHMQAGYLLGKIIEQDNQGVSYVARMLSEETFRNWQNNTQPEDGSYTVGQVVYSVPLREDISVEQARTMQTKLNSGELSSADFMENYAVGVGFVQPGQEKQVVGIDKDKSAPELMAKPFWQELFSGVTEAQAAGLEFSSKPEPTPTPIPTLSAELTGGIKGIPDPRITNPELLDLTSRDAPIPQFVNAMQMAGIEVTVEEVNSGLRPQLETPNNLPPFITYRTDDGVALIMAKLDVQKNEWYWERTVLGEYWSMQGKMLGTYLTRGNINNITHKALFTKYFSNGGVLALNGQIHTDMEGSLTHYLERTPLDPLALKAYQLANLSETRGLYTHFFCEPGRFPENVNQTNIDTWLTDRFSMLAEAVITKKILTPVIIEFNEAFHNNGTWSPAENPIRSKYNKNWIAEYFYLGFSTLLNNGLIPNKNFIMAFNEYEMFGDLSKQKLVFSELTRAREEAFMRLQTNDNYRKQLLEAGISSAEDITIVLGLQDPLKYGDNENFIKQLSAIADTTEPLNIEVILTEVNPEDGQLSTGISQADFLKALSQLLHTNDNLTGVLLWNLFTTLNEDPNIGGMLPLFDSQGNPTYLYYTLLQK
jgi:hypothetical protein